MFVFIFMCYQGIEGVLLPGDIPCTYQVPLLIVRALFLKGEEFYCLQAAAVAVAVATSEVLCDYFADSSSDSSDPELAPQDKWSCLKCKQKNQPIPRYCQHCFSVSVNPIFFFSSFSFCYYGNGS
jgi:hypothetical protein